MARIATAALVLDGRVLLAHRHPLRRHYPDCWDLVGGHVEPGETPVAAVRRECREELGVDIDDPRLVPRTIDDPRIEMHTFVVTSWRGRVTNAAPDEHDELRWYAPADLPRLTLAHPRGRPELLAAVGAAAEWDRVT